jgi:hypothetical protein
MVQEYKNKVVVGIFIELASGKWQLAVGKWQVAVGKWQLAVGNWQLARSSRQS